MNALSLRGERGSLLKRFFGISNCSSRIRLSAPRFSCSAYENATFDPPKRKKLLIVDDDPIVRKTTSMKLEAAGYSVVTASDGSSAIHAVRKEKPDLILLDLSFPPDVAHGGGVPWDGFLIMSWLRRFRDIKRVPVIVITGAESARNKDRSLTNGAIAYFQKPLDHSALLSAIKDAVKEGLAVQEPELVADFQV
jgi:CheY-like chemotaxis protein